MLPLRPMINPALRRVWRDPATVQFGLDPDRAVVIGGLDPPRARLVESLDGSRDRDALVRLADHYGVAAERSAELLDLLAGAGVLVDGAGDTSALAALEPAERHRLEPDLASLSLVHPGGGPAVLAQRRESAVGVRGLGRTGTLVCLLLAAAGVGRVVPDDPRPAGAGDLGPVGLAPAPGQRRDAVVRALLAERFPATRTATLRGRRPLDAVVLAGPAVDGVSPNEGADLVRSGTAHLYADVRETVAVLGPFVLPGQTACRQCQLLQRAERDPGWLRLRQQPGGRPPVEPCDAMLATLVATQACLHLLTYLDSGGDLLPPSADGTFETALPHGPTRRRTWHPHPACSCQPRPDDADDPGHGPDV